MPFASTSAESPLRGTRYPRRRHDQNLPLSLHQLSGPVLLCLCGGDRRHLLLRQSLHLWCQLQLRGVLRLSH